MKNDFYSFNYVIFQKFKISLIFRKIKLVDAIKMSGAWLSKTSNYIVENQFDLILLAIITGFGSPKYTKIVLFKQLMGGKVCGMVSGWWLCVVWLVIIFPHFMFFEGL